MMPCKRKYELSKRKISQFAEQLKCSEETERYSKEYILQETWWADRVLVVNWRNSLSTE
jgi:hypothetical protein